MADTFGEKRRYDPEDSPAMTPGFEEGTPLKPEDYVNEEDNPFIDNQAAGPGKDRGKNREGPKPLLYEGEGDPAEKYGSRCSIRREDLDHLSRDCHGAGQHLLNLSNARPKESQKQQVRESDLDDDRRMMI